MLVSILWEL